MSHVNECPIRVYIEDTDAGGIVFYANYLRFMERGRTEWLRDLNLQQGELLAQGVQLVVSRLECRYLRPAMLDDPLVVETSVTACQRTRITFTQRVLKDGECLCEGQVHVACISADTQRPMRLPDHFQAAVAPSA
ncbi:tol-pal system-associated acyl-CoA thioesterase [Zymobacter palmae]|uniref:Predicted thioesterase n=1 Tax=Zymobacter palmae TaxID=33074 RepID=A0A348HF13_9GAMM|nr:tol-pal system-associated acyl-CoA thioesterase [Zymobacter palmae]BBG30215.1 predicted thioesterase [Zymobacter palmae]